MNEQAFLFQMILDNKLNILFRSFTVEDIKKFLEDISLPDWGNTGKYSYYCKDCGSSWNFNTREEREFWRKFHSITGCAFQVGTYVKDKKEEKIQGVVLRRSLMKSDISENGRQMLNRLIAYKTPSKEEDKLNEQDNSAVADSGDIASEVSQKSEAQ